MADVFNEVDEQLRADRAAAIVQRGWPFVLAAAVVALLVVLGVWAFGKHERAEEARASLAYAAGLDALAKNDTATASARFAAVAASGPPGYRALSLMQQAGLDLNARKSAAAVGLLDKAAKVAPDEILGDGARLKAALILMDFGALPDAEQRLIVLSGDKRPYRSLAREALAMARLQEGKLSAAKSDFAVLALSADTSDIARARAHAVTAMIATGDAAGLGDAARAVAAMPPLSPAEARTLLERQAGQAPPGAAPPPAANDPAAAPAGAGAPS